VLCTGGTRDALVHERPPEIVAARVEQSRAPREPELHPGRLDVRDETVEGDAAERVDQHDLVPRRSGPGTALQVHRGTHVDERERHELGEPPRPSLDLAKDLEVVGIGPRPVDVPEHDRGRHPKSELVRRRAHICPFRRADLVGAQMLTDLIVEDLGGGPREGPEARVSESGEEVADAHTEGLGPLPDLQRGEPVNVHLGETALDRLEHARIKVPVEVRADPADQADLCRPSLPRLDRAVHDLVDLEHVGLVSELKRLRPAGEPAEPALEVALVGVVDVPVDDVGDRVSARAFSKRVGHLRDHLDLGTASAKQRLDLVAGRRHAAERPLEDARHRRSDSIEVVLRRTSPPLLVLPLCRKTTPRDGWRHLLARGPLGPRPRGAGRVDLIQVGLEHRGVEARSGVRDLEPDRKRGALDEPDVGQDAAQRADLVGRPVTDDQVACACGDGRRGLCDAVDLNGCDRVDARVRAERDGPRNPIRCAAHEGCIRAHARIEHVLIRSVDADRDPPTGDPARGQDERVIRGHDPGGRMGRRRLERHGEDSVAQGARARRFVHRRKFSGRRRSGSPTRFAATEGDHRMGEVSEQVLHRQPSPALAVADLRPGIGRRRRTPDRS